MRLPKKHEPASLSPDGGGQTRTATDHVALDAGIGGAGRRTRHRRHGGQRRIRFCKAPLRGKFGLRG